jgi:hypothetical protein
MITPSFSLTATERVLPSMALDFTTASLDSRVTFTRSGNTATVTNSSGNVVGINANLPRFDYDPIALTCKGLLIEEAKTNIFLYSGQLDNAVWFRNSLSVTANAIVSPDGTQNAEKLVESVSAVAEHNVFQSFIATAASYTMSAYLKAGERVWGALRLFNGTTSFFAFFNLSTGAAGSVTAGATSKIENAGNGWYRCSITATLLTLESFPSIFVSTGNGTTFYAGDGTSGIYAWGAQLELGPFVTSYIPTVASQVTRTADVATMTGTNFSSWYNASEGAFVSSSLLSRQAAIGQTTIFSASDNTSANMINCFYRASGALGVNIFAASVAQLDQTQLGVTAANTVVNTGVAYKVSNAVSYANGTVQTTSAVVAIPTATQLQFGISPTGSSLNGYVRSLRYWKQRILNAEGQAFSK